MKTIAEIRLENLRLLIGEFGTQDKVAELADTSPVYLSQILNNAVDSKTGRVRQIGDPLARKLEEAVLTWRLEAVLPKTTILERYLNVIELGPGVYGLAAAARHWFGCAPAQLSVRQAAFLAALTPAPRTISARLAAGHKLDPDTAQRIEVVLRAMRRAGVIDATTAHAAALAPLDFRPAALGR
mgnify:CR=1 FL=1